MIFVSELNLELLIDAKLAHLSGAAFVFAKFDVLWLLFPT